MESKSNTSPRLQVVLTGYGKFANVLVNPTEKLVSLVKSLVLSQTLPKDVELMDATVIEVSREGVWNYFKKRINKPTIQGDKNADASSVGVESTDKAAEVYNKSMSMVNKTFHQSFGPVPEGCHRLYLHLGVHSGSTRLAVEEWGYNCADFCAEDERGTCHRNIPSERVVSNDTAYARRTTLPVKRIVELLRKQEFPAILSNDPGTYLCNFLYFTSLSNIGGIAHTKDDAMTYRSCFTLARPGSKYETTKPCVTTDSTSRSTTTSPANSTSSSVSPSSSISNPTPKSLSAALYGQSEPESTTTTDTTATTTATTTSTTTTNTSTSSGVPTKLTDSNWSKGLLSSSTSRPREHSLFVHVPEFNAVDMPTQLATIIRLIELVRNTLIYKSPSCLDPQDTKLASYINEPLVTCEGWEYCPSDMPQCIPVVTHVPETRY